MGTRPALLFEEPIGRLGQRRQVVLPRQLCDALHLREGDLLAFAVREGGVFIKPKKLVDRDISQMKKENRRKQ